VRLLDLFSGIGGFSLAAQWVWGDELEIVAFCEIDKFCQKVLHKHWPNVPIIEDVRDVKRETLEDSTSTNGRSQSGNALHEGRKIGQGGREGISKDSERNSRFTEPNNQSANFNGIDLLTGGFPCQPFSCAGKRKGKEDNRYLWPECIRVVREIKPRWVIFENVPGIKRMVLDDCLSDLEAEGYWNYINKKGKGGIAPLVVGACSVNAPHKRMRVWIVAHNEKQINGTGLTQKSKGQIQKLGECDFSKDVAQPEFACRGGGISEGMSDGEWRTSSKESESLQSRNGEAYPSDIEQGGQDVADTEYQGQGLRNHEDEEIFRNRSPEGETRSPICASQKWNNWSTEPNVGRVVHGVPSRMDRLKSLGNAIVPQVAMQIMKAIKEIDNN